jgi:hypothetical protein
MIVPNLLIVILTESPPETSTIRSLCARLQAASIFRSQFRGDVWLLSSRDHQLFRISRVGFNQVNVPPSQPDSRGYWAQRDMVASELERAIEAKPGCYVLVSDAAGIALRNLEHLISNLHHNLYDCSEIDLFWTEGCRDPDSINRLIASPGLWAVRGEHFPSLLRKWSEMADAQGEKTETEIWSAVVNETTLKKRRIEKGEVYAPQIGSVNWETLSNAAFVTVSEWPEKEQWKFLQALYFGSYFGDETGMMLNILDA